jgi:large subunit ribosomal protein L2
MGKRLITQARGKGGPRYRASSHNWYGTIAYPYPSEATLKGEVIDIVHSSGHAAPLMIVDYENGNTALLPAPVGIKKGETVWSGSGSPVNIGCIVPIGEVPSGYPLYNLERAPYNGPELVRVAGAAATVVGKEGGLVLIKLPSKKTITLDPRCRATIGIIAGGGKSEKPWTRAGKKWLALRARGGRIFPYVSGVAKNSVDHPFGGSHRRSLGVPMTTRKWGVPPGRKVGQLAARRTGRKKR